MKTSATSALKSPITNAVAAPQFVCYYVKSAICIQQSVAPLAQLDRAPDYGSEGWEFESLRVHYFNNLHQEMKHNAQGLFYPFKNKLIIRSFKELKYPFLVLCRYLLFAG